MNGPLVLTVRERANQPLDDDERVDEVVPQLASEPSDKAEFPLSLLSSYTVDAQTSDP